MNRITIKHLRYFEALATHRHFGRAAEACAISQPALSMQIKDLEDILAAPLVERGPRQLHLTNLGEEFARRSRDILHAMDSLEDLGRTTGEEFTGSLRIGVIPTIAPYLLPQVMGVLADALPRAEIFPREKVTHRLIADLKNGQLDMAILALPVSEPELEEHDLFAEEFVLVRPLEQRGQPVPDVERLRKMQLLLLEEGHCFRDQALSFCQLSPSVAREVMEGSSLSTLVQMVGAGIGVTLIPEMAVPIDTTQAPVDVVRLANPRPSRRIGCVWRKTAPISPQLRSITEVLKEALAP